MKALQEAVNVLQKQVLVDRAERRKAVPRELSKWECRQDCIQDVLVVTAFHLRSILRKLGTRSRVHLTRLVVLAQHEQGEA